MATVDPIRISGLRDFQAALRQMDGETQKQLRVVLNEAADIIARPAKAAQPTRTGKLQKSLNTRSSQREARVVLGGARVPYAGWVEFGGRVGVKRSVSRRFIPEGRTLYPQLSKRRTQILEALQDGLVTLARNAGLNTSGR